jgi:rhodanese-related sulfurtransferase
MKTISAASLKEKIKDENVLILDVRAEEKYNSYHIDGENIKSMNIVKTRLFDENDAESIMALPKDKEIIVTCTTGNSARKCADILANKNYQVTLLEGGITAWKEYNESK